MFKDVDEQLEVILRGTVDIVTKEELIKKLKRSYEENKSPRHSYRKCHPYSQIACFPITRPYRYPHHWRLYGYGGRSFGGQQNASHDYV